MVDEEEARRANRPLSWIVNCDRPHYRDMTRFLVDYRDAKDFVIEGPDRADVINVHGYVKKLRDVRTVSFRQSV